MLILRFECGLNPNNFDYKGSVQSWQVTGCVKLSNETNLELKFKIQYCLSQNKFLEKSPITGDGSPILIAVLTCYIRSRVFQNNVLRGNFQSQEEEKSQGLKSDE